MLSLAAEAQFTHVFKHLITTYNPGNTQLSIPKNNGVPFCSSACPSQGAHAAVLSSGLWEGRGDQSGSDQVDWGPGMRHGEVVSE